MEWQLAEGVRWVQVDDGVVIFCAATDGFVDLAESAAELWTVMERAGWAERAAVHHLVDTYVVDEADAERIVSDFTAALARNGVLSELAC